MRSGIVLLALAALSGCGTILHGTHEDVSITTRPDKAQIWVDGVSVGQAPTKVSLEVIATRVVVVRAPGYKEQTIRTDKMLSGGYVAADVLLALVPVIIDAATGGWYGVAPNPMNVMLAPEGTPAAVTAAAPTAPATAPGASP